MTSGKTIVYQDARLRNRTAPIINGGADAIFSVDWASLDGGLLESIPSGTVWPRVLEVCLDRGRVSRAALFVYESTPKELVDSRARVFHVSVALMPGYAGVPAMTTLPGKNIPRTPPLGRSFTVCTRSPRPVKRKGKNRVISPNDCIVSPRPHFRRIITGNSHIVRPIWGKLFTGAKDAGRVALHGHTTPGQRFGVCNEIQRSASGSGRAGRPSDHLVSLIR